VAVRRAALTLAAASVVAAAAAPLNQARRVRVSSTGGALAAPPLAGSCPLVLALASVLAGVSAVLLLPVPLGLLVSAPGLVLLPLLPGRVVIRRMVHGDQAPAGNKDATPGAACNGYATGSQP
jgi:hypothetical protein